MEYNIENEQSDEKLTESGLTEKLKSYNSQWNTYLEKKSSDWKNWYNLYRKFSHNVEGISTKVSTGYTTIETRTPVLINNIFSEDIIIDATPKFVDTNDKTKRVIDYINNLIKNVDKGRKKAELVTKTLSIYGTAYVKVYWDTRPDKDFDPISRKRIDVPSAHPSSYLVDNFSFAYDTNYEGTDIEELEFIRERIFLTKSEMVQLRDSKQCDWFEKNDMETTDDKGKQSRKEDRNNNKDNKTYYDEFYCTVWDNETESDSMTAKEYRIWLLANNKIIKKEENLLGFRPYLVVRDCEVPFQFEGLGVIESISSICGQQSLNNYQSGKMSKKLGQSLTLIQNGSGIGPANLNRLESGVIFTKDNSKIQSEESMDPTNISVLIDFGKYLNEEVEHVSGVSKFLQGTDIGQMTATQANLINENGSNRQAGVMLHLQEDYIVRLAWMFFELTKQINEMPIQYMSENNEMIQLQPDDFYGNYTFISNSPVKLSNKAITLQQNQELIKMLIEASQESMGKPNQFGVNVKSAFEKYILPNTVDIDMNEIIYDIPQSPPPPEVPKISLALKGEDLNNWGIVPEFLSNMGLQINHPIPTAPEIGFMNEAAKKLPEVIGDDLEKRNNPPTNPIIVQKDLSGN